MTQHSHLQSQRKARAAGFLLLLVAVEEIQQLRELEEETHVRGRVARLLDAVTARNHYYGNLVMITFEVRAVAGTPAPGDDAAEVRFFPADRIPPLAFPCQEQAIQRHRERPGSCR